MRLGVCLFVPLSLLQYSLARTRFTFRTTLCSNLVWWITYSYYYVNGGGCTEVAWLLFRNWRDGSGDRGREGRLRQFVRWLVNIIAPFRLFSCHLSCNYLESTSTSTSFTVRIERRRAYEIFRVLWLSYELQLLFCYLNVSLYCFLVSNMEE